MLVWFLWSLKKKPVLLTSGPESDGYIEFGGRGKPNRIEFIHMSKRIRFGLVFVGPRPATDGAFLCNLGIKHIEGCDVGDKRYVLFALDRARRPVDVLNAVEDFNRQFPSADLDEELLMASDGMLSSGASAIMLLPCAVSDGGVATGAKAGGGGSKRGNSKLSSSTALSKVAVFEKGHSYQSHEIFRVICTAKLAQLQVEAPPIPGDLFLQPSDGNSLERPAGYWSWGSPEETSSPIASVSSKRAINELESDLVADLINPSASKRVSLGPPSKDLISSIGGDASGVVSSTVGVLPPVECVSKVGTTPDGGSSAIASEVADTINQDTALDTEQVCVSV